VVAVLLALVLGALAVAGTRARAALTPPEPPPAAVSSTYELRVYSDRPVPPGLVVRIEDGLWALALAGERFELWTRLDVAAWAAWRRPVVSIEEGHAAAYAAGDGVVLYLPIDRALWRLEESGIAAAFARFFLGDVPTDARVCRAVELAIRIHGALERGEALPAP